MQIIGIDRVVVATPDLNRTAERFEELLGLPFGEAIEPDTDTVRGQQALASRISPANIDLVAPRSEANEVARFLEEQGSGLYALAFQVADLEEAREHLADKDVEPVGRIDWADFSELFYHPQDFEGVFVLLAEYPHSVETNFNIEFGE